MTVFSQIRGPRAAGKVIEVPVTAFADDWKDRPGEPVQMGLRLLSNDELQSARGEAERYALRMHEEPGDEQNDAFNDALMRWGVARGTCQPEDVMLGWFDMAEDTVRIALTSEGVAFIWEHLEVYSVESSPLHPEATDEQLGELMTLITEGIHSPKVRRLLGYCHEILTDEPELEFEPN